MSAAFFTGGAVAGVQVSGAAQRGGAAAAAGSSEPVVSRAIALATQLQQHKKPDAAVDKGSKPPVQKKFGQAPGGKKARVLSVEQLAMQELRRRKAAKQAKKAKGSAKSPQQAAAAAAAVAKQARSKRAGRLVVIPPSRDTQGQDALDALRRKLSALHG